MKKIYKVNFITYTNCMYTTVCDNDDFGANYLDAPKGLFLVCEDDLDGLRKYGHGIDTIEFVGYLYER